MGEIILCVVIVLLAVALASWHVSQADTRGQNRITLILFIVAICSLVTIHSYCYFQNEDSLLGYLSAFLRALYNSITAVVQVASDFSSISPVLETNPWLMLIYWVSVMIATYAFVVAVTSILGRRAIEYLRWNFAINATRYLIVGCSEKTAALGEDIATHHKGSRKRKASYGEIEAEETTTRDKDLRKKKPGSKHVVKYLSIDDSSLQEDFRENVLGFGGIVEEYSGKVFERNIKLLYRKASRGRQQKNHLVIVTDSEYRTLDLLDVIKETLEDEKKTVAKSRRDSLAIHVHSDSPLIENKIADLVGSLDIRSFSEKELLIRTFLKSYPPFSTLDFREVRSTKNFTVLLAGFGDFGQTLLDYLIMNGQFLGSKMQAIIIDREIEVLKQLYKRRRPALSLCCDLTPKAVDIRSNKFMSVLKKNMDDIDILFIDLLQEAESQSMNLTLSQDVIKLFQRNASKEKMSKMIIVTRLSNGLIVYRNGKESTISIGESVYSEDTIISAGIDTKARIIHYVYTKMGTDDIESEPDYRKPYPGANVFDEEWKGSPDKKDIPDKFMQDSNRAAADFLGSLIYLAGKDDEDYRNLDERIVDGSSEILSALAQTEHLRWNAFHCVHGWETMSIEEMKDECRKKVEEKKPVAGFQKVSRVKHACLVPFDKLESVSNAYNDLLKEYGSTAEERHFESEDRKTIECIEWINYCAERYINESGPESQVVLP
jgi:hypothetical protein